MLLRSLILAVALVARCDDDTLLAQVPTPAPDTISTPAATVAKAKPVVAAKPVVVKVAEPLVVELIGPAKTITRGGFVVKASGPAGSEIEWDNELPEGAIPDLETVDKHGAEALFFADPPNGTYRFRADAWQVAPGRDPRGKKTLVFLVAIPDATTPTVPPVTPTPPPSVPETNASLLALTAILLPHADVAAQMRDFYAKAATEVRNDTGNGLKTLADFRSWQTRSERAEFGGTKATTIVGIAASIGGFLDVELGLEDVPLDHGKAAAALDRLSKACGRAVK